MARIDWAGIGMPGLGWPRMIWPRLIWPGLTGRAAFGLIGENPARGGLMHTIIKIAVLVVMLVFIAMGVNTVFL